MMKKKEQVRKKKYEVIINYRPQKINVTAKNKQEAEEMAEDKAKHPSIESVWTYLK